MTSENESTVDWGRYFRNEHCFSRVTVKTEKCQLMCHCWKFCVVTTDTWACVIILIVSVIIHNSDKGAVGVAHQTQWGWGKMWHLPCVWAWQREIMHLHYKYRLYIFRASPVCVCVCVCVCVWKTKKFCMCVRKREVVCGMCVCVRERERFHLCACMYAAL